MKRFFALALAVALIIAMGLEVSAATYGPNKAKDFKDLHPGDVLQNGVTLTNDTNLYFAACYDCGFAAITTSEAAANTILESWGNKVLHSGHFFNKGNVAYYLQFSLANGDYKIVDANGNFPQPAAKPQPKTGVMDTLPLWFGVMAVSACAYVLTSKKKVF